MAGKELKFDLKIATDQAQRDLKNTSKASKDLGEELDDTRTAGQKLADAMRQVADKVENEMREAASAAEVLEQALGEETVAAAKAAGRSVDQMVAELRNAGLTYDDIRADVDELADALKRVDDVGRQMDGMKQGAAEVEESTTRAKQGIDEVGRSADSSKSVLANMVGNSAQDLGALGGVAGSAGVAFGQMGEYMADAAAEGEQFGSILRNFATVAGPIAALSVGLAAVNSIMSEMAKGKAAERAFDVDQVEQFTDAIEDGDSVARAYNETLEETGEVLAETGQAAGPAWARILPGVSAFTRAMQGLGAFGSKIDDILPLLNQAGVSSEIWTNIVTSKRPVEAMDQLRAALEATNIADSERHQILIAARNAQDNYADSIKNTAEVQGFFNTTTTQQTTQAMDLIDQSIRAAAEGTDLAASNMRRFGEDGVENMGDVEEAADDTADAVDLVKQKYEGLLGIIDRRQAIRNAESALDDLKTAAEEAFIAQASGAADATNKMRAYEEQIDETLAALINAQAPPDIVVKVNTLVDQGKLNEAYWIAQTWLNNHPATLPVTARVTRLTNQFGTNVTIDENGNVRPGRAHGGPVQAGRMYEVTEDGKSELLHEGGKTYLMAGRDGQVEPIASGAAGAAGVAASPGPVNVYVDARGTLGLDEGRLAARLKEILNRDTAGGGIKLRTG